LRGNRAVADSVACVRLPRHAQVAVEETKFGSGQQAFKPIVGCQHHEVESCQGKRGLQFLRKHQVLSISTKSVDHRNLFELVRQVAFGIWDGHCITSISLLATAELPLVRALAQDGGWPHEGCNGKVWSKGNLQHHSWFELPFLGLL